MLIAVAVACVGTTTTKFIHHRHDTRQTSNQYTAGMTRLMKTMALKSAKVRGINLFLKRILYSIVSPAGKKGLLRTVIHEHYFFYVK